MNNQVILRLYNDRGQVPYQRCDTIMHFSTFSAFLKSSIKTLNDYRPIPLLWLKQHPQAPQTLKFASHFSDCSFICLTSLVSLEKNNLAGIASKLSLAPLVASTSAACRPALEINREAVTEFVPTPGLLSTILNAKSELEMAPRLAYLGDHCKKQAEGKGKIRH